MTTYREAKRAFDQVDAALTDALERGDNPEAQRLSEEHSRCAEALGNADLPDDPAEEVELLMQSIERYRANDFAIPLGARERATLIRDLENRLSRVRKGSA